MSEHRRRVNTGNTQVTHPLVGDDIIEQLPSVTELHDQVDLFRRVHDLMEVHLGGRGRGQKGDKSDKSRVGRDRVGKRQGGKERHTVGCGTASQRVVTCEGRRGGLGG